MKHYIANELGCVYRLNTGILEWAPIMQGNLLDTEDFWPVEPELVGEERLTFRGVVTDLDGVYATVTQALQ